jgi:hypothetical protein
MGTHRVTPLTVFWSASAQFLRMIDWYGLVRARMLRPCFSQDCAALRSHPKHRDSTVGGRNDAVQDDGPLCWIFPAAGPRSRDRMVASTWDPQLIAADFKIVRPLTGELA